MANLLVHESSPYLLQHAHNPVNWRAWNDESLALAKTQNKLILVSIGYSACHWCHVMEKQCFENEEAARFMNKYFICIKVDREERPDIDAVYMQALQLMSGQGGWPLNCFTLPDGKPVYGGTYFPLEKWMSVLHNLQDLFESNLSSMEEYAARLMNGIHQTQLYTVPSQLQTDYTGLLLESVTQWKKHLDNVDGGTQRVPKFPMPCNYIFLLSYSHNKKDEELLSHVYLTLSKMSMGGIFDQLGGGFARYSTDGIWKVPHFEKMLYDNAQLISLYSMAYQLSKDTNYKEVIEKTLDFVRSEFTGLNKEFYSALDADSEGEEGKYYVWTKEELQEVLKQDYELFSTYYNINETGHWEHGNYILLRTISDAGFSEKYTIAASDLTAHKKTWERILIPHRKKRITPGLDDKTLTSWNALMIKAYCDAFLALGTKAYSDAALANANFIVDQQLYQEKFLFHAYKKGKSTINGFLEDYACTAESFIHLYAVTGHETWLKRAKLLTETALEYFYDEVDGLFYFNSKKDTPLIARQKEVQDNVIPASNSVMATVLYQLGIYFELDEYMHKSKKMVAHFYDEITHYGSAYANWAVLLLRFEMPVLQLAIPEKDYEQTLLNMQGKNRFNVFPYSIKENTTLPFVQDKKGSEKFYLCSNSICGLPLNNQNELITALSEV